MKELKPLESSVGQPAEGKNKYFHREKIVNKILRKLKKGENLLLSAPRRIGKSSILKYIKDNAKENEIIKYLIVQSVDSQEQFFKKLYNELLKDKEIYEGISGYFTKASAYTKYYASKISGVSIEGQVDIKEASINYYEECIKLIESFKTDKQIYIFIDEFPDALNNILNTNSQQALKFLQMNRDLRINFSNKNLRFIYTGSTGLNNVVKKLDKLDLINDIQNIQVPPFSKEESEELIKRLILGFQEEIEEFNISQEVIEYILNKITWRLPYYIQIILEELFEYYEDEEKEITYETIDFILLEIVKSKSNHSDYFENWKRRLKNAFKDENYNFAIKILNYISKNETMEYNVIYDKSIEYKIEDLKYILDVLEHDGYISENDKKYGFNSILLKEWWYINVAV